MKSTLAGVALFAVACSGDGSTDPDDRECSRDEDCSHDCQICLDGECEWEPGCKKTGYPLCDDLDGDGYIDPEMGDCPKPWDCNDHDPAVTDHRSCFSNPSAETNGIGACVSGTQTCDAFGTWAECAGEGEPTAETCDGTDEDCDREIDDGVC